MASYKTFLADKIAAEDKVVTYRLLSRSLRVHVNTAKQMLYDFHKSQNDRRPGAVHATYLLYGSKKPAVSENGNDGDIEMTSSFPDTESITETAPTFSLSLIPENRLIDELAQYDEVLSLHVYSVGPNPTKDLTLLADVAQEVLGLRAVDDDDAPVAIKNSRVRRRERKGVGAKVSAASIARNVKQEAKPVLSTSSKPTPVAPKVKEASKPAQPSTDSDKLSTSAASKKAPPVLKRGGSSNSGIMQAFSKAATKVKKDKGVSQPATPSGDDSSLHPTLSDDGEDDQEMPQPKIRATAGRKSRKEREEELRRMMDDDDEEEEGQEDKAATPGEELEEEEPLEEPVAPKSQEEPAEVVTTAGDGRRRGKRRITRKKQIMDEQGYLVTIQEPGWESFSEDEAPPPTKPKTASTAPPAAPGKAKKSGPKGSQGSIMSFFAKK